MYEVLYTAQARSAILALKPKEKLQIESAVLRISADPWIGKRLTQELAQFYSCRTGVYRIVYKVFKQEIRVVVFSVGHRKSVYDQLSRKLS